MKLEDRKIRLLVIEDHPVIISGLRNMFRPGRDQIEITVSSGSLDNDVKSGLPDRFDVIFLDLWLPEGDPEANIKALIRQFPGKPVVIYTSEQSFQWQRKMFKAGAAAYLVKSSDKTTIKSTLERVFAGETVYSEPIRQFEARQSLVEQANQSSDLTLDQQKMISLLSEGYALKEIAALQGKSVSAIEKMLKHLRKKFEVRNNIELVKILLFTQSD